MAGGHIQYLITLRDQFSAQAAKIAEASAAARKNVAGMGEAANAAEKGIANLARGTGAAATGMQNIANNAAKAQAGFQNTGRAAAQSARELDLWAKNAAKIEAMQIAMLNKQEAKKQLQQQGLIPTPGGKPEKQSLMSRGAGALGAWIMGSMGVHALDKFIAHRAEVDTLREKMRFALGGDTAMVDKVYNKAFALSGKYRNTSVGENMHIIDDLRANLPESMDKILDHAAEPFVKLHGFLKAYEGGKHIGKSKDTIKEIATAIRSGELAGNLTSEDIEKHVRNIATARIVFGDKYKMGENFAAQKNANVAFNAADERFQSVYFPVLVQSLGQRAGTGLQTLYNKVVGGILMRQNSAEQWRKIGMVNLDKVGFDKNGRIDTKTLINNDWMKGGEAIGKNIPDWVMGTLMPHLTGHVKGLDGKAFAGAWKAGDVDKLIKLTKDIDRTSLSKNLTGLGYDRTAVGALEEMIFRAASMQRDVQQFERALKDFAKFNDYNKAKDSLSGSIDRMMLALTGKEFVPMISGWLDKASAKISGFASKMQANPQMRQDIVDLGKTATQTAAVAGLLAVIRRLGGTMTLLRRLGFAGALVTGGSFLVAHWEGISTRLKSIWTDLKRVFSTAFDGKDGTTTSALENFGKNIDSQMTTIGDRIKDMPVFKQIREQMNRLEPADYERMFPGESYREAARARSMASRGPEPGYIADNDNAGRFASSGLANAAAQRVMVESTVRTTIDPIVVQAPNSIQVQITGTVNGPVSGTGSIPMTTNSPRGQSAAEPIVQKVAN